MTAIVSIRPAALQREGAAAYIGVSISTLEQLVRDGDLPKPRLLSRKVVGWLVRDLDAFVDSRPESDLAPPKNTGRRKAQEVAA